jgi:molybdopterin-guanine dinucleotide biosynthesis protein A
MSPVHAVIIAGGEGRRLGGVRKADLPLGGVRLVDRVVGVLDHVERPILVATGPRAGLWNLPPGCEGVADLPDSPGGPLAGLVAAVDALKRGGVRSGMLVSAAVDTPFLPGDFVQRLTAELRDASGAYACWNDSFYPTNAIWRLEAILDLPERRGEIGSLKQLLRALDARRVAWNDAPLDPFVNVNTPEDLHSLGQRASAALS